MGRIRTIKPEFWSDEDMSEVSECACLLAIGLLNYADDDGYFNANPKLIKAEIFPIRETSHTIPVAIRELSDIGYLSLFLGPDGKQYGLINNFAIHQVVNKKKPSKIKSIGLVPYQYGTDTGTLPPGREWFRNGKESNPIPAREARPVDNFSSPEPGFENPTAEPTAPRRPPELAQPIERLDEPAPPESVRPIAPPSGPGALPDPEPLNEQSGQLPPFGKFPMFADWQPGGDFLRQAAVWGCALTTPATPQELASFVDYWQAEGKAFAQAQWEQKLARNLVHNRASPASASGGNRQRPTGTAQQPNFDKMDYSPPPGFRT